MHLLCAQSKKMNLRRGTYCVQQFTAEVLLGLGPVAPTAVNTNRPLNFNKHRPDRPKVA